MTKAELWTNMDVALTETRDALQIMYDELNQGQQQKILKNKEVAALCERYGAKT